MLRSIGQVSPISFPQTIQQLQLRYYVPLLGGYFAAAFDAQPNLCHELTKNIRAQATPFK